MNTQTLLHIKKALQERLLLSTNEVDDLETAVALGEIEGALASKQNTPHINPILIYGKEYHCWREGRYIGIGTYTDDPNIGDSFLKEQNGVIDVLIPDRWELVTGNIHDDKPHGNGE